MLALAAACINPYGPEMILVTARTVALGQALLTVNEWRPQDFSHLAPYEILMLAGFAAALYRGVKLPVLRIVMLFAVLHLSLSQSRHADLLGLLAPLFLARPLAEQFAAVAAQRVLPDWRATAWSAAATGLVLVAITGFALIQRGVRPPANITPAEAVRSIFAAKSFPVLNDYGFGGYLDYAGIRPFIDGPRRALRTGVRAAP